MAAHVEGTFKVVDKASPILEDAALQAAKLADEIALRALRMKALMFAASLRGAHDEGEAVSWMEQRGYVTVEVTSQGDKFTLTEAGKERADGIIEHDREMLG